MEEQQISPVSQDLDNFFNIAFDGVTRAQLRQAAVWAKISTICAFIGYGVTLIVAFINQFSTSASILGAFVVVALGSWVNYFLYRFAVSTIRGIDSMDSVKANEGFNNLRTYFKILGICLIIGLCLAALGVLGFLASLGAASRY
ncbi:MAG TPA: hypothetical protein VL727_16115 [Puia sp.]|jgi:hypothetical protein|nr:hypothetical protein [Puia sp.]